MTVCLSGGLVENFVTSQSSNTSPVLLTTPLAKCHSHSGAPLLTALVSSPSKQVEGTWRLLFPIILRCLNEN